MKDSTIKISNDIASFDKNNTLGETLNQKNKRTGTIILLCITLILWQGLSLIYSPIILPSPVMTIKTLISIIRSGLFYRETLVTLGRLISGICGAVIIGSILGILMGSFFRIRRVFEPFVYFIQATPPILYMTLAMIWFGLDGQATVFIIFIASMPIIAVNVKEGFANIDSKLIEMGKVFKFSRIQVMIDIIIPSLKSYFKSALIIVMGFGWKLAVMGEVLSSSTGLGSQITDARMNIETDKVFAWGIIIIFLCFLSQKIVASTMDFKRIRRKNYDTEIR